MDLDTFCHALGNLYVVLATHVLLDIGRKVVTSNTDGVVAHNAAERDHSDLGRATAYVNNHVAFRCFHVDTNADSGCHWLEDQVDIASVGMLSRVADSTKLHFCGTGRYADDHAQRRREQTGACVYHLDQATHHLLTSCEVSDHAVTEWADRAYVVVCFFVHHLSLLTDGDHLVSATVKSHYRWLVNNNLIITDDNGVGSAKVHGDFLNE